MLPAFIVRAMRHTGCLPPDKQQQVRIFTQYHLGGDQVAGGGGDGGGGIEAGQAGGSVNGRGALGEAQGLLEREARRARGADKLGLNPFYCE